MKKIKLFFILLIIIVLSGCYREESTLTINKDKSVDLEIKILVEDNFDEKDYIINSSIYDNRGIKVQRINEYGHKGYKITKHYASIDSISTDKDIKVDIYKYLDFDFDDSVLFKMEDGYFKDKYTAHFNIDYNFIKNSITSEDNTKEEFFKNIKDIYNKLFQDYSNKKEAIDIDNNNSTIKVDESYTYKMSIDENKNVILFEINNNKYSYKKEDKKIILDDIVLNDIKIIDDDNMDSVITFVVNTPRKSISNNASRVSSNGKTMTWELNNNNPLNEIMFSFDIPNNENYGLVVGLLLLAIISFLILIVLTKNVFGSKKKRIENTIPIYTGYDSSIENEALQERKKMKPNIISVKIKKKNSKSSNTLNNCDIIEISDGK